MSNVFIKLGHYIKYKGEVFIVVKQLSLLKWKIRNERTCLTVLATNFETTNYRPAKQVTYRSSDYLVTGLGAIINLTTGKFMKWSENNGNRIDILKLASALPEVGTV